MNTKIKKIKAFSRTTCSNMSSPPLPFPMDCLPFLNWSEDRFYYITEQAVVFQSLIAAMKLQPALDASLEAKAVKFLESVVKNDHYSSEAFLRSFASPSDISLTNFVQHIRVLISYTNRAIAKVTMKIVGSLILYCSSANRLALVKANLIPQIINTMNPQSLSFAEAVDIHINVMKSIQKSIWLATPDGLADNRIKHPDESQTINETILKQVLEPSKQYICYLCGKRYSIIDSEQSEEYMDFLAFLLTICPSYQPIMEFVLHMPVFLTIPSCLKFIESESSIWGFLLHMYNAQREWNKDRGEVRQRWKKVRRMLRMEGIEDVIEQRLRNDKNKLYGRCIVDQSIEWSNLQGLNLQKLE
ncbi:hypothetical protein BLNAU_12118 [Blattamonas nauphoetae]|uniref:Uncharacterized protein n=1 Tax=Blattamonas nauphoetae TaxID=2049346 RepID=A0ABQ9XKI6_9EUKA|nr:hypothetical protein BLNAU_12118 [Blattamonas nauphoetae]